MSFLNSDLRFKGLSQICRVAVLVPKDNSKEWFIKNILSKNIETVCALPIIKTESGTRKRIVEVIIPEITIPHNGEPSEFSDKRIQDLLILLRPLFHRTGNLIKGSVQYVKTWSSCVSQWAFDLG